MRILLLMIQHFGLNFIALGGSVIAVYFMLNNERELGVLWLIVALLATISDQIREARLTYTLCAKMNIQGAAAGRARGAKDSPAGHVIRKLVGRRIRQRYKLALKRGEGESGQILVSTPYTD